jgi:hypothetical protein
MKLMNRAILSGLALAAGIAASACGDDFEPKSAILGVRVLGVKIETPYAKPGTDPKLEMLLVDGSPNRGARQPKVVWFHGCTNPKGDIFFECYPDMSRRLGEAYGFKETIIDKEIPGLVTFGTEARAHVPADIISSRPPSGQGALPQGRVYVFFAACGGNVTYHPNPPNSSGLPIRCVNPATNEDLPAEEFVYGFTSIFSFAELTNTNPVIEGLEFGGSRVVETSCDKGCLPGYDCGSNNRCLPVFPLCKETTLEDNCTKAKFKAIVSRASAEPDPIASLADKEPRQETLWVEYAALNGRFDPALMLVNDLNRGWQEDSYGEFRSFKSVPGEATLYAVVRDNRGGQSWASFDVIVR